MFRLKSIEAMYQNMNPNSMEQSSLDGRVMEKEELTEEEKIWKEKFANSARRRAKQADMDPEEALKKEIQLNLNLLTEENFEKIKEIILKICCQKMENCQKVVELLVENIWTQRKYTNTFARLCVDLGKQKSLEFYHDENYFKLQLLKQIQTVFDQVFEQKENLKQKRILKILGHFCFIGELLNEKFLSLANLQVTTSSILKKFLDQYENYKISSLDQGERIYEETMEGLIKFYDTMGQAVQEREACMKTTQKKSQAGDIIFCYQEALVKINSGIRSSSDFLTNKEEEMTIETVFQILDVIVGSADLSLRLSFLMKNLQERRAHGWVTSLSAQQKPKTLKELHQPEKHGKSEKEKIKEEKKEDVNKQELKASTKSYSQVNHGKKDSVEEKLSVSTFLAEMDSEHF